MLRTKIANASKKFKPRSLQSGRISKKHLFAVAIISGSVGAYAVISSMALTNQTTGPSTWSSNFEGSSFSDWTWYKRSDAGSMSAVTAASQGIAAHGGNSVGLFEVTSANKATGNIHSELGQGWAINPPETTEFRDDNGQKLQRLPGDSPAGTYTAWFYLPSNYQADSDGAKIFQFKESYLNAQGQWKQDPQWWVNLTRAENWSSVSRPAGVSGSDPVLAINNLSNGSEGMVLKAAPRGQWFEIRAVLKSGDRIDWYLNGELWRSSLNSSYPVGISKANQTGWTFNVGHYGGVGKLWVDDTSFAAAQNISAPETSQSSDGEDAVDSSSANLSANTLDSTGDESCPSLGSFSSALYPPACWRPFNSQTPFNQSLPENPKVATNSSAIINRMFEMSGGSGPTTIDIYNDGRGGEPTYFSKSTDPEFTLHCTRSWGTCMLEGMKVRIPAGARTEGHVASSGDDDNDAHITVIDQSTNREYDLWQVQKDPIPTTGGVLNISWGGYTDMNGTGLNLPTEATAAKWASQSGRLRAEQVLAGEINHALFIVISCDSGEWVYPATKGGARCSSNTANAPPMGARFQLNYSEAEINALSVPAWKKTILRAMAKYGMFFGDTGTPGFFSLEREAGSQYTSQGQPDKWLELANRGGFGYWNGEGGVYVGDVASGIDWSRMRVIDQCVSQGTCNTGTPADTTQPSISITSPANNSAVSGIVNVSATASDNVGVTKVEFLIDNSLKLTDNSSPYNYSFDSRTLPNGSHTVSAKAYDAAGNTRTTTITLSVNNPDVTPPNAPTNLQASATNSTTVNLSWTAATDTGSNQTGVVKYNVLRNGSVIAQPTGTTYADSGRAANTQYTYTVQAVDGAGNVSNNSNTVNVATPSAPDTTAPSIPSNVQASSVNANQVNLVWSASTDTGGSGLAGYNVYRNNTKLNNNPVTSTSYGDSTVKPGTGYSYRVEAIDGAGNKSAQSAAVNVTTPDTGAPVVSLAAPANNSTASGTITITANASDDVGVSKVEFSVDGSLKLTDNSSPYNYSLDTKTLTNGSHTVSAKAYDAAGNNSTATITINVNNPDTTPPNPPTGLVATATNPTTVSLSWSASSDTGSSQTGVSKYNVLRNGVVIEQTAATSYVDSNRTSNTSYTYVVQAVDGANNTSGNSNSVTVKTPVAPDTAAPSVPGNLKISSSSPSQVNLSWSASTDTGGSGLAGYNIYRNGAKLNNSLIATTSYSDSTVASNTAYSYQVEAVDGAGNKSSKANPATTTTPGVKRGDITGPNGVSDGVIDLRDISYVIRKYGTSDPGADLTGPNGVPDGLVDLRDASYVIRNYGK